MAGHFFALEGIDGSGKSTQLALLAQHLTQAGVDCLTTCEPTQGPTGQLLRQVLTGLRCSRQTGWTICSGAAADCARQRRRDRRCCVIDTISPPTPTRA